MARQTRTVGAAVAIRPWSTVLASVICCASLAVGACGEPPAGPSTLPPFRTTLAIVGEDGRPVRDARVALGPRDITADTRGRVDTDWLAGPAVAVVRAPGYLAEPVPVGRGDADQEVRVELLSDRGGERFAMHFGGDAMFGRRYERPTSGDPLLPQEDVAGGARAVVAHLRPAFVAADFRALNLETVISTRSYSQAYPGKRFLLRSHPDSLAALTDLSVDMVSFANNHARDWLDEGVEDTLFHLDEVGVLQAGGGVSQAQAELPLIQEIAGRRIATLCYTSVTGSFVNDNYPGEGASAPAQLAASEAWLYQRRNFEDPGGILSLPSSSVRAGTVWRAYSRQESSLSETQRARTWAAMVDTFPELQDWVARRGHGGSAMWRTSDATARIAELSPEVDLLVVQLHSGFQFQEVASENIRNAARAAIDAGADVVIAHHPHVLQGMEWYKGRLIAYSLGNFVFDQDFLSTFASGFVRLVWEGRELLQARFVPLEIIGYKPTPVTDQAALRTLRTVWERSLRPAESARDSVTGGVYPMLAPGEDEGEARPVHIRLEHNTGRLLEQPQTTEVSVSLPVDEVVELDPQLLVPGNLGLSADGDAEVYVARDLFGWGHFEDVAADGSQDLAAHWSMGHTDKQIVAGAARRGLGLLRMTRDLHNESVLSLRPVARIPLARHRLWQSTDAGPEPLDPPASYALRFSARADGRWARAGVRFDVYHFDDTNPTEDPSSERLARVELLIEGLTESWQQFEIPIDPRELGERDDANMVMFYFLLEPPLFQSATLEVDDVAFLEWRLARAMPAGVHGAFTHVKSLGRAERLSFEALTVAP